MDCTVRWTGEGMTFLAETGSNHVVAMDGAPDGGGRNLAPRPMEMVLLGTGGCTAYDVVVILKKSGQDVRACEVKLTSERAATDPKVFTKIHMHFVVRGARPEAQRSRARHSPVAREILLGLDHAGQDRRNHKGLRDPRDLNSANHSSAYSHARYPSNHGPPSV